jgi:ATP synthase protein I
MMLAAIGTYVIKILALAGVMVGLEGTTAFNTRLFAFTAIVCVIAWSAAQAITSMKLRTPYVEPDRER